VSNFVQDDVWFLRVEENRQGQPHVLAGERCTFPLIAKCAMNGAPVRLSVDEKEQATTTATADFFGMTTNRTGNKQLKIAG
jgi:hypothetical protein